MIPPGSSAAAHVLRVQQAIERIETHPATDLPAALRELFGRIQQRGVLMVMSDFLVDDLDQAFASLRLFRHRRWEVIVLHLIDPDEERLPEGRAYRFEGLENDGRVDASPGRHSKTVRGALRGARFGRARLEPGGGVRLPPRVDGDAVPADAGRVPRGAERVGNELASVPKQWR